MMGADYGEAVAVAVAVAVAEAVALEVAVAVDLVCSSVVAGWILLSAVVVGPLAVRSASVGGCIRSCAKAESNVERVRATTIAPATTTGASMAVRRNSAHGEWPAWVRLRTR